VCHCADADSGYLLLIEASLPWAYHLEGCMMAWGSENGVLDDTILFSNQRLVLLENEVFLLRKESWTNRIPLITTCPEQRMLIRTNMLGFADSQGIFVQIIKILVRVRALCYELRETPLTRWCRQRIFWDFHSLVDKNTRETVWICHIRHRYLQ
jgi:hypothetical protein